MHKLGELTRWKTNIIIMLHIVFIVRISFETNSNLFKSLSKRWFLKFIAIIKGWWLAVLLKKIIGVFKI